MQAGNGKRSSKEETDLQVEGSLYHVGRMPSLKDVKEGSISHFCFG